MMSADDEILQRAQPKGFKSTTAVTPDTVSSTKKKFSLRRVTPDKNDSPTTSSSSNHKKFFGGLRGVGNSNNTNNGRGRLISPRGVRSIEKQQKMQDEYYEGYNNNDDDDDDDDNMHNLVEEELDDGELPSLSPIVRNSRFAPLSPPRHNRQQQPPNLMVENSPKAILASSNPPNGGSTRNMAEPTSETDYETLKVAGFWSQLDTGDDDDEDDDDSDSDDSTPKFNANHTNADSSRRVQGEEDMPNDEGNWRRSLSPPRNRAAAATAAAAAATAAAKSNPRNGENNNNTMGLSLVQNTSSESTIRTAINNKNNNEESNVKRNDDNAATTTDAAGGGGWNLLEMARCFAAEHRLTEQEYNDDSAESQGLDRNYNPNARVVSPDNNSNGRNDAPYSSNGEMEYEEEEGILESICVQLGNICGFGGDDDHNNVAAAATSSSNNNNNNKARAHDTIDKRRQRLGIDDDDDGDSVFEDLDGQEDVAIELGYVEPTSEVDNDANDVVPPTKKKKKGWKSFLGIKKKSPLRKTLVTETTRTGVEGEPIVNEESDDLDVTNTESGIGLNPLDETTQSAAAIGAAASAAAAAAVVASRKHGGDDDNEELESQAAGWDAKRKNEYLRQLASQAKAQQQQQQVASNSTEDDDEDNVDEEEETAIDRQDTPEAYTAEYNNFSPSDKSKFLHFINGGMSPQDATSAVIQERDVPAEEEEDYVTDGPGEGPTTPRSSRSINRAYISSNRFPDDEGVVPVQSEKAGDSGELSARDEGDLEGLVAELENEPLSQSEMASDSKNTPLETYQDRAIIPMVPATVSTKPKSRERQEGEGNEMEDQNGLIPSGIQYYDAVPEDRNDDEEDDYYYDDDNNNNNAVKKRSQLIGKPRLSKPHLSSSIASSFAAKVASKRFDSSGKNKSKYGKVIENPSSLEEVENNAPSVPMVVSMSVPVAQEESNNREVESTVNEQSTDGEEVSASKPKIISFDLMQRNKRKNFSKLESEDEFAPPIAPPAESAKSDEGDLPSWARSASRDTETVTSAFSPPIENMDDEQAEENVVSTEQRGGDDASTPDDEITTVTEYDEDTVSLMGQTFMTGASGYSRRRRRHRGAANTRVASAKEAESQAGAKSKGWFDSIQEAASKNGQVWHPEKGWENYNEPDEEHHDNDNHSSIGRLHVPQNVATKSLPPEAQAEVVGFTSPRSIAGAEFDDQSVVTKLTVNTAAESPSILTTSTAPTRRAGRKPRPKDQRKIAAAHAEKPIGWKDSMQNATNGVDNDGFHWDYEKGWIRIDGTSIDDDEASALTESVFYNDGQDADQSQLRSELLPVTEEDADEFSDDDEDVFNNVDESREVSTNEQGVSTRTVDYDKKYGVQEVDSNDGSEKENSHANKVNESPILTTESYDREDDVSVEEPASERSNPLLNRIMTAQPEEVPVFINAVEEEEDSSPEEESAPGRSNPLLGKIMSAQPGEVPVFINAVEEEKGSSAKEEPAPERSNPLLGKIMSSQPGEAPVFINAFDEEEVYRPEEITREPSGVRASQFLTALADESTEIESGSSLDPSGVRSSQFNSDQGGRSGKTSAVSSSKIPPPVPLTNRRSLNTWLESSDKATPYSISDTKSSHPQEDSVDAVKVAESTANVDSFNLESFEEGGDVFASTQVVKEKFSDTESDLFQPFEAEIKKATFESFESQGSADNDWVSTTLKRQSPVTTSDEVSQKARVWMDSMQKDDETEESSESGSNAPQVNKADPPQNLDPPSANIDARIKKRPANSWIKAKDEDDKEIAQKDASAQNVARSLPPLESKHVGSLRSKFESKEDSPVEEDEEEEEEEGGGGEEDENEVVFQSQAMGIRLKRGEDGFVRVVSVTQSALGSSIDRVGAIEPGDTIKEAAGIDLRSPITNSEWGEAVTQIRHAPRPMTFIVAAGPERKSKQESSKPASSSALPPSQNVVEYNLSKTSDGEQVLKSVREYRRHHSPERLVKSPNHRKYVTPTRDSSYRPEYDSPDRSIYSEASSVYSEGPTKDSFFNRIAACATAGAAACAPGGTQQQPSADVGEKSQVPMAHLKFLRTNPTITRVTNAAKNRLVCGRPETIFEEPPSSAQQPGIERSKSATSWVNNGQQRPGTTDNASRGGDDQSKFSSVRVVPIQTTGNNTAFLEGIAMKSAVSNKPYESKKEQMPSKSRFMVQSYSSGGGEVGWPEDNNTQEFTWQKDTIDNVSTVSAHSAKKKESARQAEVLAAAKVKAMMEDLDHDEDSECEI